ncbi:hypothetical protein BT69DRAFT_1282687 [Atractiella rhizophila]|nr:hypothetical protein BT69DRAFT_1282687 [Atractiella rhizophila]
MEDDGEVKYSIPTQELSNQSRSPVSPPRSCHPPFSSSPPNTATSFTQNTYSISSRAPTYQSRQSQPPAFDQSNVSEPRHGSFDVSRHPTDTNEEEMAGRRRKLQMGQGATGNANHANGSGVPARRLEPNHSNRSSRPPVSGSSMNVNGNPDGRQRSISLSLSGPRPSNFPQIPKRSTSQERGNNSALSHRATDRYNPSEEHIYDFDYATALDEPPPVDLSSDQRLVWLPTESGRGEQHSKSQASQSSNGSRTSWSNGDTYAPSVNSLQISRALPSQIPSEPIDRPPQRNNFFRAKVTPSRHGSVLQPVPPPSVATHHQSLPLVQSANIASPTQSSAYSYSSSFHNRLSVRLDEVIQDWEKTGRSG